MTYVVPRYIINQNLGEIMNTLTQIGKFLSLVLRHSPETIGLSLDKNGWANVSELIAAMNSHGMKIDMELLETIVATNNKKRYHFSEDKTKIRASQGHSLDVDVELKEAIPPEFLYHGTVDRFLGSILTEGLQKRDRNHVHLSADIETAVIVGRRRGRPVVLRIRAAEMNKAGYLFYLSENKVWLTEEVPAKFVNVE